MSKQREALQLALEALNTSVFDLHDAWRGLTYAENKLQEIQAKASDAIREALAEPEQEPLTDEQIKKAMTEFENDIEPGHGFWRQIARAIERAHGIGGTGQ